MRDGWEAEARKWAAFARMPGHDWAHDDINLPALRELLPGPCGRALDLGCGEGRISRYLRSAGYLVAGADTAPTVVADAAALPFSDGAFGLVVAYMCLHDMDQMPRAVAEASRVLAPGGRLCASIPHPVNSAGAFQGRGPDAPFLIAGSYLDTAPPDWVADGEGIRLTFHSEPRPIEAYSRALEAAGLLIEAIRETRAPDAMVAAAPARRRWQRIPLALHLRAVKP